jgi:hypothetical protein
VGCFAGQGLAPLRMAEDLGNSGGSSMHAMIRSVPPQSGKVSM